MIVCLVKVDFAAQDTQMEAEMMLAIVPARCEDAEGEYMHVSSVNVAMTMTAHWNQQCVLFGRERLIVINR